MAAGVPVGAGLLRSSFAQRKYTSKLVLASGANGRLAVYGVVPFPAAYACCAIGADVSLPQSSTTWR